MTAAMMTRGGGVSDSSVSDSSEEEEGGAVTASSDVEEEAEEEAITAGTKRSLDPCEGESCALAPPPTGYYCLCVCYVVVYYYD